MIHKEKQSSSPRIAIVKLSSIGDCLLATPVARALRVKHPRSYIAWVIQKSAAPVVEGNPWLSEVIVCPDNRFTSLMRTGLLLRRKGFDWLIDLQGTLKSAVISLLSAAGQRIVSSRAKGTARFVANLVVPMPDPPPHAVFQYLRMAAPLGVEENDRSLYFPLSEADRRFATAFLQEKKVEENSLLIGLVPGALRAIKQWSIENFAALADALSADGATPIVFGSPAEMGIAEQLCNLCKCKPVIAAGQTTLSQLGALLELCDVVVSGDTGPMHIAAAVGTPVVALFGPTDPQRTGPVGDQHIVLTRHLPCQPCFQRPTCQGFDCMRGLEVQDVLTSVRRILNKSRELHSGYAIA